MRGWPFADKDEAGGVGVSNSVQAGASRAEATRGTPAGLAREKD